VRLRPRPYTESPAGLQVASVRVDEVASTNDPMKAWWDMIEQFQKAGVGSNPAELWQMMFAPMQQQLDLLQKAFEAQTEVNRPRRRLAPLERPSRRPETC
jgi:hypothetical protein